MPLDKLFNLPELLFPHVSSESNNSTHFTTWKEAGPGFQSQSIWAVQRDWKVAREYSYTNRIFMNTGALEYY